MPKAKKVRAVKSISLETVLKKAEEIPITEEKQVKPEITASVRLTEASTLAKDGKKYKKDRVFIVVGEVQVNYYKKDSRFTVNELK